MFDSVLVPVDGGEPGERALRLAARICARDGADLAILHALPANPAPEALRETAECLGFLDAIGDDLDAIRVVPAEAVLGAGNAAIQFPDGFHERWGRCLLDWARDIARGEGAAEVRGVLVDGDPAEAVCDHARAHDVDLVVMGNRGRGKLGSLLLGSVSRTVLEKCACPCLIVK